jgi:hypothetical protein
MTSIDPGENRVVILDGPPPGWTPEAWQQRVDHAHLTLVRVLLRVRERLITEGKLPKDAD